MSEPNSSGLLTKTQRRLGGAAVACLSVAVILLFVLGSFKLVGLFLTTFSGVLWPVIIAVILSLLLEPVCSWIERRLRFPRILAIVTLYLAVLVVCGTLAIILLPVAFHQLSEFVKSLPELWHNMTTCAQSHIDGPIREKLESLKILPPPAAPFQTDAPPETADYSGEFMAWLKSLVGLTLPTLAQAGEHLQAFFAKVAGVAILPIYLFYLLAMRRDFSEDLRRQTGFLPPSLREDLTFLFQQFMNIIVSYFRGQILVGLILGVILATGFTVAGLKFGLVIGLAMGLLNVIPYLGSITGIAVALPVAYFQQPGGGLSTLLCVIGVIAGAQFLEGNFITPRVMGQKTGLHPMVIIFSIFFWGAAFEGILGMILAVPLTAFFVVFWRLLKTKYLPERTAGASLTQPQNA